MGSWITFDVGRDAAKRDARVEVLRSFFEEGGGLVDSSPMYGSSEEVIGHGLARLGQTPGLFSATKVWTPGRRMGISQMKASENLWGVARFDLLQIHNLLDWEAHLETLLDWKAEGRVRYIGITTSHGRRHREFERVMAAQPLDFVQLTYNIQDRAAERRLLPLAAERGLAVIANRPFRRGALIDRFEGKPSVPAQVHRLPPGRHLRDPRDQPGRPYAREHGRRARPPARPGATRADDPRRREPVSGRGGA
jgi:diketogulonate reductase-like aldo/keto reductase